MKLTLKTKALKSAVQHLAPLTDPVQYTRRTETDKDGRTNVVKAVLARLPSSFLRLTVPRNGLGVELAAISNKREDGGLYVTWEFLADDVESIDETGTALLKPDKMISILDVIQSETLQIEAVGDKATYTAAFSLYEDDGADGAFPAPRDFTPAVTCTLPSAQFLTLIERTSFAALARESQNYSRMAYTGIGLRFDPQRLTLTATNGSQAAMADAGARTEGEADPVVVPRPILQALSKDVLDEEVVIQASKDAVRFRSGGFTLQAAQTQGKLPDCSRLVPAKVWGEVKLTAGPLLTQIRQAALLSEHTWKLVEIHFDKSLITLRGTSPYGTSKTTLAARCTQKWQGRFSGKALADALAVLPADEPITLRYWKDSGCAITITAQGSTFISAAASDPSVNTPKEAPKEEPAHA